MAIERPVTHAWYFSPVNAIGTTFTDINFPDLGLRLSNHAIKERGDEIWPVLGYRARADETSWEQVYVKVQAFVTGLAISSFSNCWLSDYLYDENGKEVWRKPRTISLVIDKEGDPLKKDETSANVTALMVEVAFHIANEYPRVLLYHHIGLLLLRTPLVGYHVHAEILLNFFKIGELITARRVGQKPTLQRIQQVSQELASGYTASEVKQFWVVRSRDAAHDHAQSENVSREAAVDCKLWAEELLINDWQQRGRRVVRRREPGAASPS